MHGIVAVIVIAFQFIYSVISLSSLWQGYCCNMEVRHAVSLSAKALAASVDYSVSGSGLIAEGVLIINGIPVSIDKERLLSEYNSILSDNLGMDSLSYYCASSASIKVLITGDRFYIADRGNRWSMPYFFSMYIDGNIVHLYAGSCDAAVHDDYGNVHMAGIAELGIDSGYRDRLICERITEKVCALTGGTALTVQDEMPAEGSVLFCIYYPKISLNIKYGVISHYLDLR